MKVTSVCPDTGALFASLIASGAKVWEVRPSHGAGFKCHVGKWVAVVTSAAQGGQVVAVAKLARILTNAECAAEHGGRGIAQMAEKHCVRSWAATVGRLAGDYSSAAVVALVLEGAVRVRCPAGLHLDGLLAESSRGVSGPWVCTTAFRQAGGVRFPLR